jgi:hypothetical protein
MANYAIAPPVILMAQRLRLSSGLGSARLKEVLDGGNRLMS